MKIWDLLPLAALLTGALIPLQAASNAALSRSVDSVAYAALVLFGIGLLCVAGFILVNRIHAPALQSFLSAPSYGYIGGLIVAIYVLSITWLVPRLGVANAICLIVTGQILAAVTVDHFGLFGAELAAFSLRRAAGVALLLLGLVLAKA